MLRGRVKLIIWGWVLLLFLGNVQIGNAAWLKILNGDRITVGMTNYIALACSTDDPFGFNATYYDWNRDWGFGQFITATDGKYAVFLFEPNYGTTPAPFDTGTLRLYSFYYGYSDYIKITTWPEGNYKTGPTCGEGDPVAPSFGNMFQQVSDFAYNCRGNKLSLEFQRIFAAREVENADIDCRAKWQRPLGYGWTYNYNMYLTLDAGGNYSNNWDVRLHDGDGDEYYFTWNTTYSIYKSEKGCHDYLEKSGNAPNIRWVLKRGEGLIYYFSQKDDLCGRIDSICDNNGNKLRMTYDGTNLIKIEDDIQRAVNIRYHTGTPYIKYVYAPPDTITGCRYNFSYTLNGNQYDLVTVSYKDSLRADSSTLLQRYYYDTNHLVKIRSLPTGKNTQNNDTTGSSRKWDRVTYWYDSSRRLTYEEAVNGDGDTVLSNDIVIYKMHFKYFMKASGYPESTVVYYHSGQSATGALNPFTDTVPSLPVSNYYRKSFRFNNNGYSNTQVIIPPSGDSSGVTYGTYDADYNPSSITDPNASQTRYYYYTYHDSTQTLRYAPLPDTIIYPNSDTVFSYYSAKAGNKAFIQPDSGLDESHNKTVYLYDSAGNDTAVVYKSRVLADGDASQHDVTTRYHYYTLGGNVKEIIDPLDHKTKIYYAPDSTGVYMSQQRIVMSADTGSSDIVTQSGHNTKKCTIDTITFFRDYPNNPSSIIYLNNAFGKPFKAMQPDTSYDSLVYDKRLNVLEKYTRKNDTTLSKTTFVYDAQDHLIKTKEYRAPNDSVNAYDSTQYTYSLEGKILSMTNQLGKVTSYIYSLGRLVKISYPDNTYDSMGYWADGSVKFKRDRKGQVVAHVYDGYSGGCLCASRYRLAQKRYYTNMEQYTIYYDLPSDTINFSYDKTGNRTKIVDKNGTTMYSYDGLYRLEKDSCGYLNTRIRYEYDLAGNRTKMKVTQGNDTTNIYLDQIYSNYDNANRLGRTTVSGDNYDISYWDIGLSKRISYPTYGFYLYEDYWANPRGLIDSMKTTYREEAGTFVWFRNKYSYNGNGDRLTNYIYMTRPGTTTLSGTVKYGYDGLRRHKAVKYPAGFGAGDSFTYYYDNAGNRISKYSYLAADSSYSYNENNNELTGAESIPPGMDGCSYGYDDNGNMTSRYENGVSADFSYDFENRLVKVKQGNDSTLFYYNGEGVRLKKVCTSDTSVQYIPDGIYSAVERTNAGRLRYKYVYANGMLLARMDSTGNIYQYQHNGLGSVVGVNDNNSTVCKSYLYEEFGDSLGTWGGSPYNTYRYTGQEWDGTPVKGYNLRAREYYPKRGRFIQNDPIGNNGGSLNWYLYVANNPINLTDMSGLSPIGCYDPDIAPPVIPGTTPPPGPSNPNGSNKCLENCYRRSGGYVALGLLGFNTLSFGTIVYPGNKMILGSTNPYTSVCSMVARSLGARGLVNFGRTINPYINIASAGLASYAGMLYVSCSCICDADPNAF